MANAIALSFAVAACEDVTAPQALAEVMELEAALAALNEDPNRGDAMERLDVIARLAQLADYGALASEVKVTIGGKKEKFRALAYEIQYTDIPLRRWRNDHRVLLIWRGRDAREVLFVWGPSFPATVERPPGMRPGFDMDLLPRDRMAWHGALFFQRDFRRNLVVAQPSQVDIGTPVLSNRCYFRGGVIDDPDVTCESATFPVRLELRMGEVERLGDGLGRAIVRERSLTLESAAVAGIQFVVRCHPLHGCPNLHAPRYIGMPPYGNLRP
jgi:hypothetical protein